MDKIWELKDGGISEFWGDYSDYLRQKEEERKAQATRYEEAMRERDRLEAAIEKQRKKARQVDAKRKGAKKSNEYAGRLGHQKTTGTKQKKMHQAAKNMEKRLEALEGIEAPDSIRAARFRYWFIGNIWHRNHFFVAAKSHSGTYYAQNNKQANYDADNNIAFIVLVGAIVVVGGVGFSYGSTPSFAVGTNRIHYGSSACRRYASHYLGFKTTDVFA